MNIQLHQSIVDNQESEVIITGSKSESNRLLILQALLNKLEIKNLSNSDDTQVLQKALSSSEREIDVHHAGTAMRFLTAYFSMLENREVLLTGSTRMQERPISVLVDALKDLGADIQYEKKEGYPPLLIKGKKLTQDKVSLLANVSSQYISALLLMGAFLPNGLELNLIGKVTSVPYIKMTLQLLEQVGVNSDFEGNSIKVKPIIHRQSILNNTCLTVESDWSSASYFYSIVALSEPGTKILLSTYKEQSLQGDSSLQDIYKQFGVSTIFKENTILLQKLKAVSEDVVVDLNLSNAPDIAQTIAVTCYGLGVACNIKGLHTLKIKETDRLEALRVELSKLGANIEVTNESLHLKKREGEINENISIATYQDHRMAMAFAPLALKVGIVIEECEVVSKSYPGFWQDLKSIGFKINKI
ncbi:3-phosphoshikimate 1-carboxyvinyltransferase [Pseudofulvibacter geojedonensis]|uniref:3-phosphoshikimate 1-carboxyvinyltransferase n=1 Tax=Pseudofulvibacter geojedonensis TaxID=1123758 RepID=A0ABW3I1G0_9FLAO